MGATRTAMRTFSPRPLALVALALLAGGALARPLAPQLASRAEASYTLYLDFSGFDYAGTWYGKTPGSVPAFTTDGDATTFTAGEEGIIRDAWARVAQKYTAFNVNVTTIDPAVAAGRAGTDADRQTYYGSTAKLMHTIIGGSNAWFSSGAGGVSYVGTTQYAAGAEYHTNWAFPDNLGRSGKNIGEAAAHENGHGLSLNHQNDESDRSEYSTNGGASGNGSYAPTLGVGYSSQRSVWRTGKTNDASGRPNQIPQDDVRTLLSNDGIGDLVNDGIGGTFATATPLPVLTGGTVDAARAQGIIVPKNGAANGPLGVDSYTSGVFSFLSLGGAVTLTANDGSQFLAPGQADPGATLDSTLSIFDGLGNLVGTGIADASTLKETFSGTLARGQYYARVSSRGGYVSSREPNSPYYTMGSYFLTGSGVASVPEPATLVALGVGAAALLRRRRRA